MIDSLFDKKTAKRFDTIAKEKAKLRIEEKAAVTDFMAFTSRDTILKILDIVEEYGHPNEINLSRELRNKYCNDNRLEFDDLITLNTLYKSNYSFFKNKGDSNE